LNTRLRKLDAEDGGYDAIVLAAAGVVRLGWAARVGEWLDPAEYLWAVGQGALGVQCRAGDDATLALLQAAHHIATALACEAERSAWPARTLCSACAPGTDMHAALMFGVRDTGHF
jgi:hydroxymethylbilane synthase